MTQRDLTEGGVERTPEEIEAEIIRTRAAVHQDIKAIGEKFTADQVKENAKGVLSDVKQEGATMVRDAKDTAVDSLRSARDQAVDSASNAAHAIGERAREAGVVASDYARQAGDYARRAGSSTAGFVRDNALPLSLIGVGVGWLVMSMRKQQVEPRYLESDFQGYDDDYYSSYNEGDYDFGTQRGRSAQLAGDARSRAGNLAHTAQERIGSIASTARDKAGAVADSARERVGALADRAGSSLDAARTRVTETASHLGNQATEIGRGARVKLQNAQVRTRDFADENPLAVGAIAVAAGVGVGLLLPTTQPENRLMGAARDKLIGSARGVIDEARDAATTVGTKAREAAQELRNETRMSH